MTRTVEIQLYKFNELSDAAKKRARDWWRKDDTDFDYDFIYDDAAEVGDRLGFDIRHTRRQLMDGTVRYDPTIYWSGFWSQGDGACFEGTYSYKKGCVEEIKKFAPNDKELLNIAEQLVEMQRPWFYKLSGKVKHRGHYYHERSMECRLDHPDWHTMERTLPEQEFADICADFAMWIYKRLREEYEYRASDEAVDEALVINEYEFTEDGDFYG